MGHQLTSSIDHCVRPRELLDQDKTIRPTELEDPVKTCPTRCEQFPLGGDEDRHQLVPSGGHQSPNGRNFGMDIMRTKVMLDIASGVDLSRLIYGGATNARTTEYPAVLTGSPCGIRQDADRDGRLNLWLRHA